MQDRSASPPRRADPLAALRPPSRNTSPSPANPPNYGPDYIHQFNETYVLLARKYHVAMLPFLLQGVVGVPGMMQADQTHATEAGNQIVAENVLNLITPLLKH